MTKLVYSVGKEDYEAFFRQFLDTSDHARRTTRRWQWFFTAIAVGCFAVLGYTYFERGDSNRTVLIATLGLCYMVYLWTYFPVRYKRRWMKNYRTMDETHPAFHGLGEQTIEVEDGITSVTTPDSRSEIPSSKIHEIVETDTHCFIYLDGQRAYIVPKESVVEGSIDDVVREIGRAKEAANA